MRLAFIHYHLQPGGVTRVIQHGLEALKGHDAATVVLTGEPPCGNWPSEYRVIPGLRYEEVRPRISSVELAAQLEQSAREALGGLPDIWHVHNHSLGKNLALPEALCLLAEKGHRLLLHIHDFAEDGRPDNYHRMLDKLARGKPEIMSRLLYPSGGHIHYAVLTGRDFGFLRRAGADPACLHRLPNLVKLAEVPAQAHGDHGHGHGNIWLYPTRAIRRKNIGEFLLWAAVSPGRKLFATTSGPLNPRELPRYEAWRSLAAQLRLPVEFELTKRPDCCFEGLLREAQTMLTTSMAEGFGMAFLEPWLANRPVCGRDLPEITREFREEGIRLPHFYERLNIPVRWLGRERIAAKARAGLRRSLAAYGRKPGRDDPERVLAAWISADCVDFGRLDEELQEIVLRRVVGSPAEARALVPWSLPDPDRCAEDIESNRRILREKYGLQAYGRKLMRVYGQLLSSRVSAIGCLNGEILLDFFLAPERLTLLRVD